MMQRLLTLIAAATTLRPTLGMTRQLQRTGVPSSLKRMNNLQFGGSVPTTTPEPVVSEACECLDAPRALLNSVGRCYTGYVQGSPEKPFTEWEKMSVHLSGENTMDMTYTNATRSHCTKVYYKWESPQHDIEMLFKVACEGSEEGHDHVHPMTSAKIEHCCSADGSKIEVLQFHFTEPDMAGAISLKEADCEGVPVAALQKADDLSSGEFEYTEELFADFSNAVVTQNNLGGLGPDVGDSVIRYEGVGVLPNGNTICMTMSNTTTYTPNAPKHKKINGKKGSFGVINVACGSEVFIKMAFYVKETGKPVQIENFFISFLDFDTGKKEQVREYMGVHAMHGHTFKKKYVTVDTTVAELPLGNGDFLYYATEWGTGKDNPKSIDLTGEQKAKAVTLHFEKMSEFTMIGGSTSKASGFCNKGTGRNLLTSFKTNLAPTSSPTPSPTSSPTPSPTESPTPYPTSSPTESPTPSPTEFPTESPTSSPTYAKTYSPTPSPTTSLTIASATGDPHMTNMLGERFDVNSVGTMEFLRVPYESVTQKANLTVFATIEDVSNSLNECNRALYITSARFGGAWLGDHGVEVSMHHGKMVVSIAGVRTTPSPKPVPIGSMLEVHFPRQGKLLMRIGAASLTISHDIQRSHFFLNMGAASLRNLGCRIGGLLGEDSHDHVSKAPSRCQVSLLATPRELSHSVASASLD